MHASGPLLPSLLLTEEQRIDTHTRGESPTPSLDDHAAAVEPYPGYTGPRCYEPGGKVWHPC